MIVVTVTLKSAISAERDEIIGQMLIGNTKIETGGKRGDYEAYVLNRSDAKRYPIHTISPRQAGIVRQLVRRATRSGTVKNYPRLSYNVWRLVLRALRSAFPEEKGR